MKEFKHFISNTNARKFSINCTRIGVTSQFQFPNILYPTHQYNIQSSANYFRDP